MCGGGEKTEPCSTKKWAKMAKKPSRQMTVDLHILVLPLYGVLLY